MENTKIIRSENKKLSEEINIIDNLFEQKIEKKGLFSNFVSSPFIYCKKKKVHINYNSPLKGSYYRYIKT